MKLPIRLDQFIKRKDIAQTGGHAKILIQNGEICVNSEVELRRGRKLVRGDVVTYGGQSWEVSS